MVDWNKSYANAETRLFGDAPNEYMREVLARSDVAPKSILCLADGDGRNGSWLAAQGYNVTAVDISEVATEQASAHDKALGVSVERITADLATWSPNGRTWDAVFLMYLQCEAEVRNRAATLGAAALSPGGWFAAEGFAPSNNEGNSELGPSMPELLYERDDLIAALGDGMQIVEAFKGWTHLKEGKRHQGKGWVLRLLAQRV